ncbi:adenylate/guanylate cyclase domain-containing protein [Flavobacterium sp. MMLR14_040]|uniref:adenylate/guanylate cyclase domain-containing protein n=1 Tax=Flavobacterium sp. MMLR14_040 TaxID=3093843 RepID=UPI0029904B98|nr:adenylate/guanylate cyclase domain-containing protein [Flavobacterium sp. MMLR14_040]MDW8848524.1 adenylate/guanylate cyclase domain-containing protein [Flavobacterium sp. MMLR14_040]
MELPKIPFYKKYSLIFKAIAVGGALGLLYAQFTDAGLDYGYLQLLPGTIIGCLIGFFIITFEKSFINLNKYSFIVSMVLKALIYSVIIVVFLLFIVVIFEEMFGHFSYQKAINKYVEERLVGDFLFSLAASILLILFLEISSLLSSRFFYNYFTGRYHRPMQEERIFMFVDVKSSTTMAEELGDILYSKLLQDLFNDFTDAILASRAEVYQYAGDEIILTWKTATGIKDQRCLYCFYLLKQSIEKKNEYYLKTYNRIPKFKAGMHIGNAVTTWVGKVKKEIVYHGDLLNTTSRIQCKCNDFNHDFVISEAIKEVLPKDLPVTYAHQGEILLRGKAQPMKLYTVDFNIDEN